MAELGSRNDDRRPPRRRSNATVAFTIPRNLSLIPLVLYVLSFLDSPIPSAALGAVGRPHGRSSSSDRALSGVRRTAGTTTATLEPRVQGIYLSTRGLYGRGRPLSPLRYIKFTSKNFKPKRHFHKTTSPFCPISLPRTIWLSL